MDIFYDSLTGNVKRFIEKLPFKCTPISEVEEVSDSFVLVTYTTGIGQVPENTLSFLQKHGEHLAGVACSGNRIWGERNFCKAGKEISRMYGVPLMLKFELAGFTDDIKTFIKEVGQLEEVYRAE